MRIIRYELFPEAYGSNNKFVTKDGSVANLIHDTGMLLSSDFDKVIPSLEILNTLLLKGSYPRAGEWEPFQLSLNEYDEVVDNLISLPLARPYRIDYKY